jgi:hypothetical protein
MRTRYSLPETDLPVLIAVAQAVTSPIGHGRRSSNPVGRSQCNPVRWHRLIICGDDVFVE